MEVRAKILAFFLFLGAMIVVSRLFFWQVVKGPQLSVLARSQYLKGEELFSRRGSILARDGQPLAITSRAWSVWVEPQKFDKTPGEVSAYLAKTLVNGFQATRSAELLNLEKQRIYKLIGKEGARWVLVREKINSSQKAEIEKLNLSGINFIEDQARMYPEGTMAATLLGFVGKNEQGSDQGYFGLEGFYDLTLSGKSGFMKQEKDAKGNPIPFGLLTQVAPVNGFHLHTFIDRTVQYIIEKELKSAVEKYSAKRGSVTVITPSGEVLGMTSFPSYDPGDYKNFDTSLFKNPVVSDSFEPGSVFKVLVMASALDSGEVSPDTRCDNCTGPVSIDKYSIKTWNDKYFPDSTMSDIITHSDNVGMVFVAGKLGIEKTVSYLGRFGIGQPTAIDLQEEASPNFRASKDWSEVDLATAGFGQGIAVTPIQFIRGVAAIANGGVLPEIRLVGEIASDGFVQDVKNGDGERVISKKSADEVRDMMVRAVEEGEAKWAKPQGFRIAGKTGTAQIPIAGHYDPEKTIASFVGFAPSENPKFVMLVTLQEPASSPWGSETAAPLWFSIAKELFPYFGIQPSP